MNNEVQENKVGELVRKMELEYTRGDVTISDYVTFDMYKTINTIEAYLNSKHISGQFDSQGREKPFFNIVTSAANIWQRATDIDRKNIQIKASKRKDTIPAFLGTIVLQDWMNKANFGYYLNDWGRVLARYGSAVTKFVEKDGDLVLTTTPWNRLICDPIDFENNPKIEVLELTEAQLRKRGYDKDQVESLTDALTVRETIDKRRKDNKSGYIKLYEVHGELPLSYLTGKEKDEETYVQQMHVISYVKGKKRGSYDDYTLYKGREADDPYMITHLMKEDGRSLSIGAVENLFQAQWMQNHTVLSIKNQLDFASKLIYQTTDGTYIGQNILNAVETGDILVHAINQPLTLLNNNSHDVTSYQNFGSMWKTLGNEINGISEAMLGAQPKAGTAWRQTEALLQESYSLFELMTENKGLALEQMIRRRIIPFLKRRKLNSSEEIVAELEAHDIDWIDSKFLKNFTNREVNKILMKEILKGEEVTPEDQAILTDTVQASAKEALNETGVQRFFKPSDISDKTWKEQLNDLEWNCEVDITGENKDYKSLLATVNTALQVVVAPGFDQNPRAKMLVDKILQATGGLSPIELAAIRSAPPATPMAVDNGGASVPKLDVAAAEQL